MHRLSKLLILLLPFGLFGQDIPIETWRNHFSYSNIKTITSSERSIICATENGIFFVNKSDHSTNFLSKLDGLSDVGASDLTFDKESNSLVIGYPTGLIDIYRDGEVITVTTIYESLLVGDKSIKDIEVRNGKIYASNGFGIIVINLENGEIIENYQSIGEGATDILAYETSSTAEYLTAITNQGLKYGRLNQNLLDFNNWTDMTLDQRSYRNLVYSDLSKVTLVVNDTSIFEYDLVSKSETLLYSSPKNIVDLNIINNKINVLIEDSIYLLKSGQLSLAEAIGTPTNCFYYDNEFWYGTTSQGLLDASLTSIEPNGPIGDNMSRIVFTGEQLYALYGPNIESYNGQYDGLGFNSFDNSQWEYDLIEGFDNLTDVSTFNGQTYLSSAGKGIYNLSNSSKLNIPNSSFTNDVIVSSLAAADNLYIACYDHQTPLIYIGEDGVLNSKDANYTITKYPIGLDLSQGETIWLKRSSFDGGGIITLELEEDNFRVINTADGLPSNRVHSMAISLSDEAWVGTQNGLVSFSDATYIFEDYEGIPAFFDSDELFNGVNVTATEVDGGNRVWVGTENQGIWVFDSNFSELVYRFTFLNSPLPSNSIKEFAYNPVNGEMFILTSKGLTSFRSNSSFGDMVHSNVNIYPNPVRPGYSGKVGISGLVNNAYIKIADVNGKLIRELRANGGSVSWDLLDYNNRRVESGVYVVFSSEITGEETYIGKLAVVNQ
ncbi:MAG: hypothetical protein CMB80_25315 [Flammeovirgaceae bacterium]|nr:hypothetical protein [Flammeovirgaceae bacterium]MBE63769.1 hypothetical protein [Flammeovirgaceae bacterium]MBR07311.1 hypothetical protein [Rickettsiales bacterium]HCX23201.1 hypothetical protein [Cytophagales bacterium]|tara:strand:+ start:1346 stop:3505 length:2160 start_codon:yes stop_codon:yes gene_type:complete